MGISKKKVLLQIDDALSQLADFGAEPSQLQIRCRTDLAKTVFGDATEYKGAEIVLDDNISEFRVGLNEFSSDILFELLGDGPMSKPKRVLFLDDRSKRLHAALKKYAPPEYDLTLVCTVKECIKMISNEPRWDIVSLDHDLDFEEFVSSASERSGMEIVRWMKKNVVTLLNQAIWPEEMIIHSSNRVAGIVMRELLAEEISGKGILSSVHYEKFDYYWMVKDTGGKK